MTVTTIANTIPYYFIQMLIMPTLGLICRPSECVSIYEDHVYKHCASYATKSHCRSSMAWMEFVLRSEFNQFNSVTRALEKIRVFHVRLAHQQLKVAETNRTGTNAVSFLPTHTNTHIHRTTRKMLKWKLSICSLILRLT